MFGDEGLIWVLFSVALSASLTVMVNLISLILSGPASEIPGIDL
jgi:hypothetical protein